MSATPAPGGHARVGCSGWVYQHWRGRLYPEDAAPRDWFRLYASRFDTVEINNTFYRLPARSTVDKWRQQAPTGFVYAVKVGQFGTHRKKLRDAGGWLTNHLDRVRRLGAALGPSLVQLPPRWHRDVARLDDFLHEIAGDLRWAVEFRDPTWLHDDVYALLRKHGVALCIHDLLDRHPWIRTADWTYVRFHGPRNSGPVYGGRYSGSRLWHAADRLAQWQDEGSDVYAYFNNDAQGAAVDDAAWLSARLGACATPWRNARPIPESRERR